MYNSREMIKTYMDEENKGHNVHQEWKERSVSDRKRFCDSQSFWYAVMCINVCGDLNIGSIIRSASIHGADEVILYGRKKYDKRSTVGAENYINVRHEGSIDEDGNMDFLEFETFIENNNLYPMFIEQSEKSVSIQKFNFVFLESLCSNFHLKPCFIFGNETNGIPENLLNKFYDHIHIPQRGVIRSLNVSNAANIVLWEYRRQLKLF